MSGEVEKISSALESLNEGEKLDSSLAKLMDEKHAKLFKEGLDKADKTKLMRALVGALSHYESQN